MAYIDDLRDPRWQKMRLLVLERKDWHCEKCGDDSTTLNVHHAYYERGKKPWEYPPDTLHVLCDVCHEDQHRLQNYILRTLGQLPMERVQEVLGFCYALVMEDDPAAMRCEGAPPRGGVVGMMRVFGLSRDTAEGMAESFERGHDGESFTAAALVEAVRFELEATDG